MLDPLGPKLFLTLPRGTNATTIIPSDPLCTLSLIFVVHRDPMSWSPTYAFDTYSSNLSLHAVYIYTYQKFCMLLLGHYMLEYPELVYYE